MREEEKGRRGEEKGRRGREKRRRGEEGGEEGEKRRGEEGETRGRRGGEGGDGAGGVGVAVYIGKFRRNYRRHLIVVGAINFRRKLIEMRTKKVRKSRQTFRSVGDGADGHVSDMRGLSVMPSVCDVGNAVGDSADGHVSDMRAETRR